MTVRLSLVLLALLALDACGGGPRTTLPDESADLHVVRRRPSAGRAAGPEAIGTRWRFAEAHCTEGPLDLSSRGFTQELHVTELDGGRPGFMLVYDQTFETAHCAQTVMLSAIPSSNGEFQVREEQRISVPATPACESAVRPDPPRPGEVRLVGSDLEVLVQRSNWCGGFEVRMTYQALPPEPLREDQIVRRYIAYFNRKDVASIASLFADTGSLVEPFTVSDTGGPTRHEGREAVASWYAEAFEGVPWVGLRLTAVRHHGDTWTAEWEYMDGRLEAPFAGTVQLTIAAGEIFEAQLALTRPPPGAEGAVPAVAPAGNRR